MHNNIKRIQKGKKTEQNPLGASFQYSKEPNVWDAISQYLKEQKELDE